MRFIVLVWLLPLLMMTGCAKNPTPLTPAEQDEQETRMRNFLYDTAPRNMDRQVPKVTPEFSRTFNLKSDNTRSRDSSRKPAVEDTDT